MLNWNPVVYTLGVTEMDETHQDFVVLANRVAAADDAAFPTLFDTLMEHTRTHFENESRLMRKCRFAATGEHESEHRRVLAEMAHMQRFVTEGRHKFARLYVAQGVPDWFRNHLATMDAALAACLKRTAIQA